MTNTKIAIGVAAVVLTGLIGLTIRHEQALKRQPYHYTTQQTRYFSERLNFGKKLGLALQTIAEKNGGNLPLDPTPAASWLATNAVRIRDDGGSKSAIKVASFELVYKGNLSDLKDANKTIMAREKDPVEVHEGQWNRIYVLADGALI